MISRQVKEVGRDHVSNHAGSRLGKGPQRSISLDYSVMIDRKKHDSQLVLLKKLNLLRRIDTPYGGGMAWGGLGKTPQIAFVFRPKPKATT
jgi:hypothetical protein